MKQSLKPYAYKQWEPVRRGLVTACLLQNEPASCAQRRKVKQQELRSRSESESEEGEIVAGSRPETR